METYLRLQNEFLIVPYGKKNKLNGQLFFIFLNCIRINSQDFF